MLVGMDDASLSRTRWMERARVASAVLCFGVAAALGGWVLAARRLR